MEKKAKLLLASAAAGLMTLAATTGSVVKAQAETAPAPDQVKCYGVNKCKGTGDCGGKGYSCAGNNQCAGQGFIKKTKEECLAMKGGRLTAEPEAGAETR